MAEKTGITRQEAADLPKGTWLMFGETPNKFELHHVDKIGAGLRLTLIRDDGYTTFATHEDLDVARVVDGPVKPIKKRTANKAHKPA